MISIHWTMDGRDYYEHGTYTERGLDHALASIVLEGGTVVSVDGR